MFGRIKGKFKSKLLTYLFTDWLYQEQDKELLEFTKEMITQREYELDGIDNPSGRTIIKGFKRY
jgi:hypothetical protein